MTARAACCRTALRTPLPVAGCARDGRHLPVLLADLVDLPGVAFGTESAEVALGCAAVGRSGETRHAVRVNTDWSVVTRHDAAAESVAVALGGEPVGCTEFATGVLPAVREHLQLAARRALPAILGQADGVWRLRHPVAGCCDRDAMFSSASQAAAHVRGLRHLALLHRADVRDVGRFAAAAGKHCREPHGTADSWSAEEREAVCHVREDNGLRQLWDAGLHPRVVCRVHALLGARTPLPVSCYLALLGRRPDLVWIAETAAAAPESPLHSWLAETETALDRARPEARARWVASGTGHRDVEALSAAGYTAADVAALAGGTRVDRTDAVAVLRSWTARGLAPPVAALSALHQRGFAVDCQIERSDVAGLRRQLARRELGTHVNDEDLALLLLVCGSPVWAFLWADAGWTDPIRIADAINRPDRPGATATG